MRTLTQGTVKAIVPDAIVWLGDNNFVTLTDTSDYALQATIVIGSTTLRYLGTTSTLRFNITSALKLNQSISSFTITTRSNNVTNTFTVSMSGIYNGKTLQSHLHASEEHIIIPPNVANVELYSPAACSIASGIQSDTLTAGKNTKAVASWGSVQYTYPSGTSFNYGSFDNQKAIDSSLLFRAVVVERKCIPEHGVVVKYTNTDGCTRYLVGVIVRSETTREVIDFLRSRNLARNIPSQHIVGNTESYVVQVAGVPRSAFAGDIMFSDTVTLTNNKGRQIHVSLASMEVTDNTNEIQDYEFIFNTLA